MTECYAHEERTGDLISILTALKDPNCDTNQYIKDLDGIYYDDALKDKDGNLIPYRHSYSAISVQLHEWCQVNHQFDADVLTVLIENIGLILDKVGSSHRLSKPLTKLQDHICLESVRIAQLGAVFLQLQVNQQSQEQLDELIQRTKQVHQSLLEYDVKANIVQEDIKKKKDALDKMEDDIANVHAQSISVLSIFAGMAFIFTGGFTMLSGVFTALQKIDKHTAVLLLSVLIFVCTALIDAIWILIRSARKYMKGGDKLPRGFYVFTILTCAIAIVLFALYLWDPWGFMSIATAA